MYCNHTRTPLIFGCDANAHDEFQGITETNKRGLSLSTFRVFGKDKMPVLNIGNTLEKQNRSSKHHGRRPNNEPNDKKLGSTEPYLSDHKIILFDIEGLKEGTVVRIRHPRSTD